MEAAEGSAEGQNSQPVRKRRRPNTAYLVLTFVALAAVGGYVAFGYMTAGQVNTDDAQIDADSVPIGARVSGQILTVAVADNQVVKQGDVLAVIDPKDYEIRVSEAEAEFEAAEAQAEAAAAKGSERNFAQVMVARAALSRSQAELRKAETDLGRDKRLKAEHAITQVELENTQNSYDKAAATEAQASAQLRVAEQQHSIAEAKVKAAQAALDTAKTQLGYTKITAPRDGTLSKIAVQPGQYVQTSQMVAQLVAAEPYVVANFKETQVGKMRPDQRVEIEVDAFPGQKFGGKVTSLAAATGARFSLLPPDNASGNFVKVVQRVPVKIALDKATTDVFFRAGMSADVTVYIK